MFPRMLLISGTSVVTIVKMNSPLRLVVSICGSTFMKVGGSLGLMIWSRTNIVIFSRWKIALLWWIWRTLWVITWRKTCIVTAGCPPLRMRVASMRTVVVWRSRRVIRRSVKDAEKAFRRILLRIRLGLRILVNGLYIQIVRRRGSEDRAISIRG